MASQLLTGFFIIVDGFFIGQSIGDVGLASINILWPIAAVILATGLGIGSGGSVVMTHAMGAGDTEKALAARGNTLLCLGAATVLLTAALGLSYPWLLRLLGATGELYQPAADYTVVVVLAGGLQIFNSGLNPLLRGSGRTVAAMAIMIFSLLCNILLDWLFIAVFAWGMRGAALATVIAQGCSAVWVLKFLTGRKAILRLRLRNLALGAGRVKSIVALGLSGFFMNLTNSLVQVVCNATLQAYGGDLYVGVMTIINSLREVFFMPVQGLTNGAQPVTGYNYGAGRYSRVRSSIRFSVAVTVGYAAVFWAAAMLFPGLLIRVFNSEPEVVAAGIPALRIYFCLFIPMSLQMAGQGVFVSLGRSKQAVFFSLLRKAIINAPLTVVLPIWMGTTGVFTAEAISQLVGGLACSLTMYFTVYRPLGRLPDRPPENI